MKLYTYILSIFLLFTFAHNLSAQGVGINQIDPDTSAVLAIVSTNKGVLIPRMTSAQRAAIPLPAKGLMVFDSTTTSFWFYKDSAWAEVGATGQDTMLRDADDDTRIQLGANTDEDKIRFTVDGELIMILDSGHLEFNSSNTYIGEGAGKKSPFSGTGYSNSNTFVGQYAGYENTEGFLNTFIGASAGDKNVDGNRNVFIGNEAGYKSSSGDENVFIGIKAGFFHTVGDYNTLIGSYAGHDLHGTSSGNTMLGAGSGSSIRTGHDNVLIGEDALRSDTAATENVILGVSAGENQLRSVGNVFLGSQAGRNNKLGDKNIFIGHHAGAQDTNTSNTLIIENSNSKNPLIYGDFANDTLRVHGTFDIRGNYSFPDTNGSQGQVMMANGSGNASWGQPNVISDDDKDTRFIAYDSDYLSLIIDNKNVLDVQKNNAGLYQFATANNHSSIFWGASAGQNSTAQSRNNIFIGYLSGEKNTDAWDNICIGTEAGKEFTGSTSQRNIAMGTEAASSITDGTMNTVMGYRALATDTVGTSNVVMGALAGFLQKRSFGNVYLGAQTGFTNDTGSYNVFVGHQAGNLERGSNKLYINNSGGNNPLIYGEFENALVGINGKLGVGTKAPQRALHLTASSDPLLRIETSNTSGTGIEFLNGGSSNDWKIQTSSSSLSFYLSDNNFGTSSRILDLFKNGANYRLEPYTSGLVSLGSSSYPYSNVYAQSGTVQTSDRRMKKNIENLDYGLKAVMAMRPVSFDWINRSDERASLGFIAQEMEEVVPEVVVHQITPAGVDKQGNERPESDSYAMKYAELIPVLVKAVQEQQAQIEQLQAELEALKGEKK